MADMIYPPKPRPGDRIAILSPSAGLPAVFPDVYELGLSRLRDEFGLTPVEFPTTRAAAASARERAQDITAAFADPSISAVMASIGGDDQITVLRHLDDDVIRANPKPFFGFSDNTNLLNHLFGLGVVAFHGGAVMTSLARGGAMHPLSASSLRAALFTPGWHELTASADFGDEPNDWADAALRAVPPPMSPADGWTWEGPQRVVAGPLWGGCLEILSWLLQAGLVAPPERFDGHVLVLETSEDMPSAADVYYTLRSMGERGMLGRFAAVLVGRAKAWNFDRRNTAEQKAAYRAEQRAAIRRAVAAYAPDAVLVFDLDIGHTDPQQILPIGGDARVDGVARRISVRY
ncbi:S66 family peptidase [Catellatospora citrea]|uniref:LD-carboxypeptidase n=1 Tax=Catellatospora citrea TaxID=53366 RepID=A0A8J3P323_9ACTN|nr:S66 peptidase family protein [Catellatospora citrea]RKE11641.1 muramoyltetrapeptide carboxypeptidase LdcA involved in peptidoglycan recycling [Catellatospora citrea]GIG02221.1 LD-carboxypeptidase [Catellatospora citrea]